MTTLVETKKKGLERLQFILQNKKNEHGFTLMEVVITVAIVLILSIGGFIAYSGFQSNARDAAVESAAQQVYTGASAQRMNDSGADLEALAAEYNTSAKGITASVEEGENDICVTAVMDARPEHSASRGDCNGENTGGDGISANQFGYSIAYDITVAERLVDINKISEYETAWNTRPFFEPMYNSDSDFTANVVYQDVDTETVDINGTEYTTNSSPMKFTFVIDVVEEIEPDTTSVSYMIETVMALHGRPMEDQFVIPLVGNDTFYWVPGLTSDTAEYPWLYIDAVKDNGRWELQYNFENDMYKDMTFYTYDSDFNIDVVLDIQN